MIVTVSTSIRISKHINYHCKRYKLFYSQLLLLLNALTQNPILNHQSVVHDILQSAQLQEGAEAKERRVHHVCLRHFF